MPRPRHVHLDADALLGIVEALLEIHGRPRKRPGRSRELVEIDPHTLESTYSLIGAFERGKRVQRTYLPRTSAWRAAKTAEQAIREVSGGVMMVNLDNNERDTRQIIRLIRRARRQLLST